MVDISSARPGTGSGPTIQRHEWRPQHLAWLAVAAVVMF